MGFLHNIQGSEVGVVNAVELGIECNQCFDKVEVISLRRIAPL